MFIDVGSRQETKHGQNACGDFFLCRRPRDEGRVLAVLSDGLGSGVKASILARMTATMLLGFVEEDIDIAKAAEIMLNSLPVCRVRQISYATFSLVECDDEGHVRVVEEGNPEFFWLRGSRELKAPFTVVPSASFPDRLLKIYRFRAELDDRLVFCTDGVTQAGLGRPGPAGSGLGREGLADLLKRRLERRPSTDSHELARCAVDRAAELSPGRRPADDVSAAAVHFRTPRKAVVFTGPPYERSRDAYYAAIFDRFVGRKAVCGGTTANLLARELGRTLKVGGFGSGDLPPTSTMDGVDLITEGVLTLSRASAYLEQDALDQPDAAGSLVRFLLGADVIRIMEGSGLNGAALNPSLNLDCDFRRNLVKRLAELLRRRHLKTVTIQRI
ncbi:MAG: serine/threonine-protein phosphatase [Deltaproteobacteria bacterium]|jgi:hypothetical protein|nr:serine/threonine-protein phosphatase [Deltaproteobacteria bacterium]